MGLQVDLVGMVIAVDTDVVESVYTRQEARAKDRMSSATLGLSDAEITFLTESPNRGSLTRYLQQTLSFTVSMSWSRYTGLPGRH